MKFAKALRSIRLQRGMTQPELADELEVARSTVSMWEQGEREPNFATLCSIANTLHISIDYLIDENLETDWSMEELNKIAEYKKFLLTLRNENANH